MEDRSQREARTRALEACLDRLAERGVEIVDPRQTWIGTDVDPERLHAGAVLYPGTRLAGPRCQVGRDARVGHEGPATLVDTVLDDGASIASGFAEGAVLLAGASAGANAHLRPGTVMEERSSTAHAVGLKQTILLPFVTLGSLINFCDCLMAGGTSRQAHSEVGSGFIHFNLTPRGAQSDKATPSLVGDVPRGVFLREPRIFLGGSAGMVGPRRVGYGSVTGAGQVLRTDVGERRLVMATSTARDLPFDAGRLDPVEPRRTANVAYVANLIALRAWYVHVRAPRLAGDDRRRAVIEAAIAAIDLCVVERKAQLARFLEARGAAPATWHAGPLPPCPLAVVADGADHVAWVQALAAAEVAAGVAWLESIVRLVCDGTAGASPPAS